MCQGPSGKFSCNRSLPAFIRNIAIIASLAVIVINGCTLSIGGIAITMSTVVSCES